MKPTTWKVLAIAFIFISIAEGFLFYGQKVEVLRQRKNTVEFQMIAEVQKKVAERQRVEALKYAKLYDEVKAKLADCQSD